jgi:hypothetical protein
MGGGDFFVILGVTEKGWVGFQKEGRRNSWILSRIHEKVLI